MASLMQVFGAIGSQCIHTDPYIYSHTSGYTAVKLCGVDATHAHGWTRLYWFISFVGDLSAVGTGGHGVVMSGQWAVCKEHKFLFIFYITLTWVIRWDFGRLRCGGCTVCVISVCANKTPLFSLIVVNRFSGWSPVLVHLTVSTSFSIVCLALIYTKHFVTLQVCLYCPAWTVSLVSLFG
jgi:hypothetical protein